MSVVLVVPFVVLESLRIFGRRDESDVNVFAAAAVAAGVHLVVVVVVGAAAAAVAGVARID